MFYKLKRILEIILIDRSKHLSLYSYTVRIKRFYVPQKNGVHKASNIKLY